MNIDVTVLEDGFAYGGERHKRGAALSMPRTISRAMIALGKVEIAAPRVDESLDEPKKGKKGKYQTKDMKAEG